MYVLKTYKVSKITLPDNSYQIKTKFDKLVFCANKKEFCKFTSGLISTISCNFGSNELFSCLCEQGDLNHKPYLNGCIIYNTNNPNGKIQEYDELEIVYNCGSWYTKDAILSYLIHKPQ